MPVLGDDTNPAAETSSPGDSVPETPSSSTEAGRQDSTTTPPEGGEPTTQPGSEGTTTPSLAPLTFDQSYYWMLQLLVLVTAMTMFFPFLRNLFGLKPRRRQVANYTMHDSEDDDDEIREENFEEECSDDE